MSRCARCLAISLLSWLPLSALAQEQRPQLIYVENQKSPATGKAEILLATKDVPTNLTKSRFNELHPAFSPDGEKIAFSSDRDGTMNIYVINADGSELQRITQEKAGGAAFHCASWSPDGTTLAFQRRKGDDAHLITHELESGRERVVTDDAWDPQWSPLGNNILFTGRLDKGGWGLYTVEPDGGKLTEILTMPESKHGYVYPTWSPDGKKIAFTTQVGEALEIHLCDPDGKNLKQLTKEGRWNTHAAWTPDGKKICFWHDTDGKLWQWKTITLDTEKVENMPEIPAAPHLDGLRISWRK